jgi:molybdopterin-guanine dinucleotide biosynthesis protein A
MTQIEAFILVGGASSRMGSDKAHLLIAGKTFVERIATTLRMVTPKVSVVGGSFENLGVDSVKDVYPNWGALGGLHAALSACGSEWAAVLACDLPFVTADLLLRLAEHRSGCDAVVPRQEDDRPQPLCALYRIDPCRAAAAELIQAGRRRPLDLLESVNTCWVPFSELKDLDNSSQFFVNINTPEDYYEATQRVANIRN